MTHEVAKSQGPFVQQPQTELVPPDAAALQPAISCTSPLQDKLYSTLKERGSYGACQSLSLQLRSLSPVIPHCSQRQTPGYLCGQVERWPITSFPITCLTRASSLKAIWLFLCTKHPFFLCRRLSLPLPFQVE